MEYEMQFLEALALTIAIETLVLFVLFKTIYKDLSINNYSLLLTGILTSLATLPYLWFIFPLLIHNTVLYHITGETFVVLAESVIILGLLPINYKKALIVSIACNAASYLFGLIIF